MSLKIISKYWISWKEIKNALTKELNIVNNLTEMEKKMVILTIQTVVLERTLESPMDCKEIQPVHSKGGQSWVFTGGTDVETETPILLPPHVKS